MSGTITTSTGLISGIDIESLVEKLMTIEKEPVTKLKTQVSKLEEEKAALQTVSAKLLSLKLTVTPFKSGVNLRPNTATSSNEDVLTVKANSDAVDGQYSYTVLRTAQTHQLVSRGFEDSDQTAIGQGTITIEQGEGTLDRDMDLNFLRNQQGIRKGTIRITDRSGASADVDLAGALTVSDILEKINDAGIGVTASVSGDRFVLTDTTGSTSHNLVVQDLKGGYTASDLGLVQNTSDTRITGNDLVGLTESTGLKNLNDENGVQTSGMGEDLNFTLRDGTQFGVDLNSVSLDSSLSLLNNGKGVRAGSIKITNSKGVTATVDLSSATTMRDVIEGISNSGVGVSAVFVGGTKLLISDSNGGDKGVKIENVDGSGTATDLGIENTATGTSFTGNVIYRVSTLGDVKRAIEDAASRATNPDKLTVSISADGKGISLSDTTGGTGALVVSSSNNSQTAEDLGIAGTFSAATVTGERLVAGLNTVLLKSLNGGSGVARGTIEIQNRAGQSTLVDLGNAATLEDVMNTINNTSGIGVTASLNSSRTGILLKDTTGSSIANLKISDVDSTTAHDLKIDVDTTSSQVNSGNNQLQYISQTTALSSLNGGKGLTAGSFTITDSSGGQYTLTLTDTDIKQKTLGDLITMINGQSMAGVKASINSTGDGLLLTDTEGGALKMSVVNKGVSTLATELNIAGEAETAGASTIDGSMEYEITVGGSDTLQGLADKINGLKGAFTASIVDDGTGTNSYHLMLTSKNSGKAGELVITSDLDGINLYDLVKAQDAVISLGGTTGGNALVTTSSSNTFKNLAPGLTLTAVAASSNPVTVTVTKDVSAVTEKIQAFVDAFNEVVSAITEQTNYDTETNTASPLLGNVQVENVRSRLYSIISSTTSGLGDISRFSSFGISVGTNAELKFDTDKFQSAYAANYKAIESFFSTKDKGLGYILDDMVDSFTDSYDGSLSSAINGYDDRMDLLNNRIDYLNELLTSKEERYYNQFANMETALAKLQTMQTALQSLSTNSSSSSSSSSSS